MDPKDMSDDQDQYMEQDQVARLTELLNDIGQEYSLVEYDPGEFVFVVDPQPDSFVSATSHSTQYH